MASKMLLRPQPLRMARPFAQPSIALSTRFFTSIGVRSLRQTPTIGRPLINTTKSVLRQPARRQYADQSPQAILSPPATKPKRRFRFFRTLWRITYLSALGGVAYLAYTVYDLKYPVDQSEPDATKKTLVVLGMASCYTH